MELLMEELVEVTVLIEGLMPYGGYTPVMAAVWETHAAGSIGRMGSPAMSKHRTGYGGNVVEAGISAGGEKNGSNSLLGRAKQLRGFGSQHLATVSVIGLEWKIELQSCIWVQRKYNCCLRCSSPWLVHDVSENAHRIVVAHVLEVNVVHLRKQPHHHITLLVKRKGVTFAHTYWVKSLTCSSMSPGSMRPSAATAPPFIMEPM